MAASWLWIPLTLGAAAMQTVRTAGQKRLSEDVSNLMATLARFLFGLPFALAYLGALMTIYGWAPPTIDAEFLTFTFIAAVSQIIGTVLLIHMFSFRNFTVGTAYARTEAFLTAVMGALFFSEVISPPGWAAISTSIVGVVLITVARGSLVDGGLLNQLFTPIAGMGVASGLGFALAALSLRRASLSLGDPNFLATAALTLVMVIAIETVLLGAIVAVRDREQLTAMRGKLKISTFIGATSMLGSVGWFTAMTLEQASYVRAFGQIEFVFAMLVSTRFFREKYTSKELAGIALIAASSVALVFFG
jgi:drug/metabolite transporter (DMT)-like permease